MKCRTGKKRDGGFTLVETLAATGILVILLAVIIVAVVYYSRWLKITELDNTAREIYLAAENRALLLNAGGQLADSLDDAGGAVLVPEENGAAGASLLSAGEGGGMPQAELRYIYYDSSSNAARAGDSADLADLLPDGAVDPALRGGCFYVVYDVYSGSTTDVFYAEDSELLTTGPDNFEAFYTMWRESPRAARLNANKMIGYYGGESAGSGNGDPLSPPRLLIINGEELQVVLIYNTPLGAAEVTPNVRLTYEGTKVDLMDPTGAAKPAASSESSGGVTTHTYTWVVDTLAADGPNFADLFRDPIGPDSFGGDFAVEAELVQGTLTSPTVSAEDNSLFAKGSGDETAYIENLRHLQNLDKGFSGVGGKTRAEQIADIDCGESIFTDYEFVPIENNFVPIENNGLKAYCGSHAEEEGAEPAAHFIKGLTVTEESASGKNGGLFSRASGASKDNPWEFTDIRLINTSIKAESVPAGALVGYAADASFENCWIYWEPEDRSSLVGDGDAVHYQIIGSTAGGMVGSLDGGTIDHCLSATLVDGKVKAGGLAGYGEGITVEHSYADCYVTGKQAGGLIGGVAQKGTSMAATLTDVYTAGFIDVQAGFDKDHGVAGVCAGSSTVQGTNVYAAMNYLNLGSYKVPLPTVPANGDFGKNCHYLQYAAGQGGMSYQEMTETKFVGDMGGGFESRTPAQSHPYNLLEGMALTVYPFPGLKDLPHYGDWNAEFTTPALAYFETYQDDTGTMVGYGFYGGNVSSLRDDCVVPLDGYAVALRAEDAERLGDEFTITYRTALDDVGGRIETYRKYALYPVAVKDETYYLAPLPDDLVNSETVSADFYQYLSFAINDDKPIVSAYCPHFAKTAVAMPGSMEGDAFMASMAAAADHLTAYVRTPRHLNMLSRYPEYYHPGNQGGRQYAFRQELDLDYNLYTGYDGQFKGSPAFIQAPIGSYAEPFTGIYDGGCHTIQHVRFRLPENSSRFYAGLFGYSAGALRNVVYLMDADNMLTIAKDAGNNLYLGGLAGGSSGSIANCAVAGVNLRGQVYKTTNVYIGGLVGENGGTIRGCAAESALLSTSSDNYAHAYAGGLIGSNTGSGKISGSYAVGRISTDVGRNSSARVCGFVGSNAGDISGCYAAVNLHSSGSGVETYGFCGEKRGTQSGTFFLNSGNFSYRDVTYNASYAIREETKASPIVYQDLTTGGSAGCTTLSAAGMRLNARGAYDPNKEGEAYPYPSGVKDANGKPVHYGRWPQQLNLGIMGVYYWEKLEIEGGRTSYDVSLLAVDLDKRTVAKQSTLSNAHSDNGVVTDYGYGYYETISDDGAHADLDSTGILYTEDGENGEDLSHETPSASDVDAQLRQLMPGYEFHSYHSFVPNPDPNVEGGVIRDGLCPVANWGNPNGTITLRRGDVSVEFEVNPHFADALALTHLPSGWIMPADPEITTRPGASNDNPYEVRAMGQLSAINWNSATRDTKTVMVGETREVGSKSFQDNTKQFPYLSTNDSTGKYFWKQTHDIDGDNGVYTPIAEYYTIHKSGKLNGWFGGAFDGDDYVIENVNIQGQTSSVAGLFGVVLDGTLNNIVLYSSDGTGYVTASFDIDTMLSVDYYMGTLAGLAATSGGTTSAIKNCSAAGYTINYKTYNIIDGKLGAAAGQQPGGSGVGGLLGASNMELKNCSAVTTIRILANENNEHGNDNLRVGGLVGIAKKSITNCYAGGKITVGGTLDEDGSWNREGGTVLVKAANGLFLGGIVGGNYFETLGNISGGSGNIRLENCYSYVVLPSQKETELNSTKKQGYGADEEISTEATAIRGLYVLGGIGDGGGNCTITNCYYLEKETMKHNQGGFDTTTVYHGGSEDGNERKSFTLKTDIPVVRTSAQVIESGEITLTKDDVKKDFMIDFSLYQHKYTRTLEYDDGTTVQNQPCYYMTNDVNQIPGMPIFVPKDTASGTAPAVFMGWTKEFKDDASFPTQVLTDPSSAPDGLVLTTTISGVSSREITLTKDDVGKTFTIDLAMYAGWYTRKINGESVMCRYFYQIGNPRDLTRGEPVFTLVNADGSYNDSGAISGTAAAVFRGWVVEPGSGHGSIITLTNDPAAVYADPRPITYDQLSGTEQITKDDGSKSISERLPAFGWVTKTTADGFAIPGKYSYACADGLQGLNYPFPTILTQERGSINVHYGDWPLYGIERDNGGAPVELNLFGSGAWREQLRLSAGILEGGSWEVVKQPEESAAIAAAEVDQDGRLTVTGKGRGLTEVTVRYTVGGVDYDLPITVRVDAVLQFQAESTPVYLFTGDSARVRLFPSDELGGALDPEKLKGLEVDLAKSLCGSNRLLVNSALGKDDGGYYLDLTSASVLQTEEQSDQESLSINVYYTYQGVEYNDISSINICVVKPAVETDESGRATGLITFNLPDGAGAVKVMSAEAAPASEAGRVVLHDAESGGSLAENQLKLEGFVGEVTVTAVLETALWSDVDGADPKPVAHTVTVAVTIPEPEPGPDEGETANDGGTVTADSDPQPGLERPAGDAPDGSAGTAMGFTTMSGEEAKSDPAPAPAPERYQELEQSQEADQTQEPEQSQEADQTQEPEQGQEADQAQKPEQGQEADQAQEPEQDQEADQAQEPEQGQNPEQSQEPGLENVCEPPAQAGGEPAAVTEPAPELEDTQGTKTKLGHKMRAGKAVKRRAGAGRRTLHGTNFKKAALSGRGVDSARLTVLLALRNGRRVGADGSGVQWR